MKQPDIYHAREVLRDTGARAVIVLCIGKQVPEPPNEDEEYEGYTVYSVSATAGHEPLGDLERLVADELEGRAFDPDSGRLKHWDEEGRRDGR